MAWIQILTISSMVAVLPLLAWFMFFVVEMVWARPQRVRAACLRRVEQALGQTPEGIGDVEHVARPRA